MAEENVTSSVTPQKDGLKARKPGIQSAEKSRHVSSSSSASRYRRTSVGSYYDGDSSGRSSSGKPKSTSSSQEAVPHYLRASTGSCHDFCKYGRKHTFEEKPWRRLSKRISKPPPSDQLVLPESPILLERKVEVVKPAPRDAKAHLKEHGPSLHAKTLSTNPPEVIKHEVSLPSEKTEVSPEQQSASGKKLPKTELKSEVSLPSKKPTVSAEEQLASLKKMPKTELSAVSLPSKKPDVSTKQQLASLKKMPKAELKSNNTFMRRSPLGQPKAMVVKSPPSFGGTSARKIGSSQRSISVKDGVGKTVVAPRASLKKILRPAGATTSSRSAIAADVNLKSRKNGNLKLVSPLKNQNRSQKVTSEKTKNGKIPEKILHVIKTETLNSPAESVKNGDATTLLPIPSSQSPKTVSHNRFHSSSHEEDKVEEGYETQAEEEGEETEFKKKEPNRSITGNKKAANLNEKKIVEGNRNSTLKKGRAVVLKDKNSPSLKLKFRRGKVVELQSQSSSPRRLLFRRGKSLLGNEDGKTDVKRSFKKKTSPVDEKVSPNPSTRKIVLRHQNVQDKKEAQGLLNNVIEETASKLVETRKSKVKALVGAFETVISLQETKPSAQAVN